MGLKNIIPTIMMGKIDIELPAIHMMNIFIGTCLIGPNAMSHDLFIIKVGSASLTLSAAVDASTNPTGFGRLSDDATTARSLRPLPEETNSIAHLCRLLDMTLTLVGQPDGFAKEQNKWGKYDFISLRYARCC